MAVDCDSCHPCNVAIRREGELALQSLAIVYAERCGAVWKDPQVYSPHHCKRRVVLARHLRRRMQKTMVIGCVDCMQVQPWLRANLSAVVAKITDDPEVAERARAQREAAYSGPGSRSVYRHVIMAGMRQSLCSRILIAA